LHFHALKLVSDNVEDIIDNHLPRMFKIRFRFFNFSVAQSKSLILDPLSLNQEEQIPLIQRKLGVPFSQRFVINDRRLIPELINYLDRD